MTWDEDEDEDGTAVSTARLSHPGIQAAIGKT